MPTAPHFTKNVRSAVNFCTRLLPISATQTFGLAVSVGRTLLLTSVHVGSPDSHRHHVLSLYLFVTAAATPLAALAWGTLADRIGIDPVVGGAGVLVILIITASLLSVVRHRVPALPRPAPTTSATAS